MSAEQAERATSKSSLWIRLFSRVPLFIWYPVARFLAWMSWKVIPLPPARGGGESQGEFSRNGPMTIASS